MSKENPGSGLPNAGDLPDIGPKNGFGYDADGHRMPYANGRPGYAPDQEIEVWRRQSPAWNQDPATGAWTRDPDVEDAIWVRDIDGKRVKITWSPGDTRVGNWDMGHVEGEEYHELRRQYLNHELDPADPVKNYEEFLRRYRDAENYQVEHPSRNRSRKDEATYP